MVFELSPGLFDEIVKALENQECKFVVDSKDGVLIPDFEVDLYDDRFYLLPEWDSEKGFELRKDFVGQLHVPAIQNNLQEILYSGRGVFKNFKNELKKYPQAEKLWYRYKHSKMKDFITDWYNDLREIWGLEHLQISEQDLELNDDLLQDDFVFNEYDKNFCEMVVNAFSTECYFDEKWPCEIQSAILELYKKNFISFDEQNCFGYVCCSLSNEFAGCITVASVSERTKSVVVLSSFFVPSAFRGLGIGTELLEKCLAKLKVLKKEWILITNTIIPDYMEPVLLRMGFEKIQSGFVSKI